LIEAGQLKQDLESRRGASIKKPTSKRENIKTDVSRGWRRGLHKEPSSGRESPVKDEREKRRNSREEKRGKINPSRGTKAEVDGHDKALGRSKNRARMLRSKRWRNSGREKKRREDPESRRRGRLIE